MLKIHKNKKYFCDGSQPFFWLGDTAWLLLQKLSLEETEFYFKNRSDRCYNVIQAVLAHNKNIDSEDEKLKIDFNRPEASGEYWAKAEAVIGLAAQYGINMAYLPVWGSMVKKGYLNIDNVAVYAEFLAKRFGKFENLIWILGGDIRGSVGNDVWNIMGRTLKKYCPQHLISFHPFGRTCSGMWFNDSEWLDFNMFQSGHRAYDQASLGAWDDNKNTEEFFGEDNWRYVQRELDRDVVRPVIDGEPSYEHIHQGLHAFDRPLWSAKDVRRYAYWSVFEGAAGHTYGSNAVMQFYSQGDTEKSYDAQEYWQEAINLPGGAHMRHLYTLMTSLDFCGGSHDDNVVSNDGFEKYDRITAFSGAGYILVYNYSGRAFSLTSPLLKTYTAQWFDPTKGSYTDADISPGRKIYPPKNADGETDMLLVLKTAIV